MEARLAIAGWMTVGAFLTGQSVIEFGIAVWKWLGGN